MTLRHVRDTYDTLGRKDPLYAVLSMDYARGNRWEPQAFFARGELEINTALHELKRLGLQPARGCALDFGCGVGRLTQALCQHFDTAVGVDISAAMIEAAQQYNRHGERCRYLVNTCADLALLDSASVDFVYSNISLQHSPPQASQRYIAEFFRILRPGGVALFQMPSGPRLQEGSLGEWWYKLRRGPLRRAWKRLRGKPPVEMHWIARSQVEEIIAQAGGELRDVRQEGSVRRDRVSLFYTAIRN
jgi:SAM-dependent methyltransferase